MGQYSCDLMLLLSLKIAERVCQKIHPAKSKSVVTQLLSRLALLDLLQKDDMVDRGDLVCCYLIDLA